MVASASNGVAATPEASNGGFRGIKEIVDAGIQQIPDKFIRPVEERPNASEVYETDDFPVIDLTELLGAGRQQVVEKIDRACREWGFFQVINHGIPKSAVDDMLEGAQNFFAQPVEEKMRIHSTDLRRSVAYLTTSNRASDETLQWKESLAFRFNSHKLDDFSKVPEICRESSFEFLNGVQDLAMSLYEAMSEGLGLEKNYMFRSMGENPEIRGYMHYYPPCPDPSLTFGLSAHSDVGSFTILLQDDVGGLQVLKDNKWFAVKPVPDSFVVNIANQIEILTNGTYRSVDHRVVTNSTKARLSVPCFFTPLEDTFIGPAKEFVHENSLPLYKETRFAEYLKNFTSKKLSIKSGLQFSQASS